MDLGLAHSPRALSGPCTCAIVRCDSHSLSWYRLKPCPDRPPLGAIGHAYQAPKFVVRVSALTIGHACPPNDAHQDGHRNQGLNMKPCLRAKGCLHPLWASPCSRPNSARREYSGLFPMQASINMTIIDHSTSNLASTWPAQNTAPPRRRKQPGYVLKPLAAVATDFFHSSRASRHCCRTVRSSTSSRNVE